MKRRISILLVLVAFLLLYGGTVASVADAPRKITGGLQVAAAPEGPLLFYAEYNIREAGPDYAATGWVQWRGYDETGGWLYKRIAYAICVDFGEYDGQPATSYVGVWPDGYFVKYWALDGGTPGREGDNVAVITSGLDKPDCYYEEPENKPFMVVGGNLVIHD